MKRVPCAFLRAEVPAVCSRKTVAFGCVGCQDEINERAAILQYGQGTGWHDLRDPHREGVTCRTRDEAERMARAPIIADMKTIGTQLAMI